MKARLTIVFLILLAVLVLTTCANAAPTVHKVTLQWTQATQPANVTLTGNSVYRGTTTGGPYTLVFASSTPITTYTDTTVTGGTTYFYVVTAVAGTQESAYSNEVSAAVPVSPNPPMLLLPPAVQ